MHARDPDGGIPSASDVAGWAHLALAIDLQTRMIVGWQLAPHMRQSLVDDALALAIALRPDRDRDLVHHGSNGSQGDPLRGGARYQGCSKSRRPGVPRRRWTTRIRPHPAGCAAWGWTGDSEPEGGRAAASLGVSAAGA